MQSNSPANQLTIASEPSWVASLEAAITRTEGDTPILPKGQSLTLSQRDYLTIRAKALRSSLSVPPGDSRASAAQIFGMFAAFPAQNASDEVLEARMAHYLGVANQYPSWAVAKAVKMWMNQEGGMPNDNYAFPPSPPQLSRLIKLAMRPVYLGIHRLEKLAAAREEIAPPTAEQRARVDEILGPFRKASA